MTALPHAIAALALALGIAMAQAASPVPSSVMPGRERDRFTESPVERFMQPGPYQSPPVITPYTQPACPPHKSKSRSAGQKSAKCANP
jgi:hypothetical protein